MHRFSLLVVTFPLIFSVIFCWVFYPGFMSYDSIHALYGAREGVSDAIWPPMVSYIWRVVDWIYPDPVAMLFFQLLLLLVSLSLIVYSVTRSVTYSVIFLMLFISVPVVLGTMSVIWKDVLMASLFVASVALSLSLSKAIDSRIRVSIFFFSLVFIFLGTMVRHNAVLGALPLYVFAVYCYISSFQDKKLKDFKSPILSALISGLVLTVIAFSVKFFVFDRYSLPTFNEFNQPPNSLLATVKVLDVAGASVCSDTNLFGELAPDLTMDFIRSAYIPKHVNLSEGLLRRIPIDSRIDDLWFRTLVEHPICFFYNKFELFLFLAGLNSGDQFLITDPNVTDNKYGYHLEDSLLRNAFVTYVVTASNIFFFRPWFIALSSFVVLVLLYRKKMLNSFYILLFFSASFYFFSLVFFGNAADARLSFYSTTIFLLIFYVGVMALRKGVVFQSDE